MRFVYGKNYFNTVAFIFLLLIDRLITKSHINIHFKIFLKIEADMQRLR